MMVEGTGGYRHGKWEGGDEPVSKHQIQLECEK